MSGSGIIVNAECTTTFQRLAEGKKEFRYIIFKIQDNEIVVERSVKPEEMAHAGAGDYDDNSKASFEEFLEDVKRVTDNFNDCRYAVFDFKCSRQRQGAGMSKMDKSLFFQICPDSSPMKKKMVYASSAHSLKEALGTGKIIIMQVNEENEMNHKIVFEQLCSKSRD